MAAACKTAQLPPGSSCEFDTPDAPNGTEWREGLRRLLASFRDEAHLTVLGQVIARGHVESWLATRLRLIHAWGELAAGTLAAEPIERPIFIVGYARTGTTFLINLLKQDPALRTPLHWELMAPIPAHGSGGAGWADHIAAIQRNLDQFMHLLPGMADWHPMSAEMAEECVVTFAHEFKSFLFGVPFEVPSYMEWLLSSATSHAHSLAWHRRVLQFLQRRAAVDGASRGGGAAAAAAAHAAAPPRWVLKTPMHLMLLDEIGREYPDAVIVQTHRAPAEFVGSLSSVTARMRGVATDRLDLRALGAEQERLAEETLRRGMDARARWAGRPPVDVQLAELKRAPMAAVERLYAQLGLDLSPTARTAMEAWLARKTVRHGSHAGFALQDFGLSREGIMANPVFRRYCEEYRVRC